MTTNIKIGIVGCTGRMGRVLLETILQTSAATLAGAVTQQTSPFIGKDIIDDHLIAFPPEGIAAHNINLPFSTVISDDADTLFQHSDCVIDFTLPIATEKHLDLAVKYKTALVIGTTGFSETQFTKINDAAQYIPLVQSGNMSLGVNLLAALTQKVASILDDEFDIEILEMHHKHKVDAPSGTALLLGNAAAKGRNVVLKDVLDDVRTGHTGARKQGNIGMAVLRGGSVVGEHTVTFINESERIELKHTAGNRAIFAKGAVKAALWVTHRQPGYYTMTDVLGL